MLYYRVKKDADQRPLFVWGYKNGLRCVVKNSGDILIANELYTPAERAKIANSDKFFEPVNVKKSDIYFFFGARFANDFN